MSLGRVAAAGSGPVVVRLCSGSACVALGALEVLAALRDAVDRSKLELAVSVAPGFVGCRGFCSQGPLIHLPEPDILYCRVAAGDVDEILARTVGRGDVVERLLYLDPVTGKRFRGVTDNPFFAGQQRKVLSRCGAVDPEEIDHAIALGAYAALEAAVERLEPAAVIELVKRSGLQECGGSGFPVGLKWEVVAESSGSPKFVVGNGDSGDPGLTVDRTLLEGDPHAVIEGMVIAGYAVGASAGRLFLRSEHGLAVARSERALAQARRRGFLGSAILGSAFSFDIEIWENAGASMGGEETAVLAALEGRRAIARPRPPFPAVSGLHRRPTLVNCVETLANVPLIVNRGRHTNRLPAVATKVVGLAGAVARPGLAEVALGTTVREVVEGIGGGAGELTGVHVGGPGGATLGPEQLDTALDLCTLRSCGVNLGAGGLVALGAHDCPVELARFFVEFYAEESCGVCPPCRIGTRVALSLLDTIGSGSGEEADLDRLERVARHMGRTSLCELGRSASRTMLASLHNFRTVYERHVGGGGCPSRGCRSHGPLADRAGSLSRGQDLGYGRKDR